MWQILFTFVKTSDCGKMIRCLMENAKEFGSKRQGVLKKCLGVLGETPRGFDANDLVSHLVLGIR